MSGIEVGDYIKTNKGVIGKIKRIEFDKTDKNLKWYVFNKKRTDLNVIEEVYINKPYIEKHSKNIIDLIEVGDILEAEVDEMYFKAELDKQDVSTKLNNLGNKIKIISILTKEQYNQNCYRLED